jgi:hypothetical protein
MLTRLLPQTNVFHAGTNDIEWTLIRLCCHVFDRYLLKDLTKLLLVVPSNKSDLTSALLVFAIASCSECLLMNPAKAPSLPRPARLVIYWR